MNLPDLEPTDIGIIAFWNALDHWKGPGAKSIDPTDCAGVFDSYDVYDNGIQGWKALGSGRHFNARVKSDGWMIAWVDRTNSFAYPNKEPSEFGEDARKGYYDILWNWFAYSANISSTQTTLSYLISLLYNALSNKSDFDYSDADVGHYCYEYPDANVLTLLSLHRQGGSSGGTRTATAYLHYTEGTILYYAAVTGSSYADGWDASLKFDTHTLLSHVNEIGSWRAAADILAEGWMPEPLQSHELYVRARDDSNHSHGSIIIIWS